MQRQFTPMNRISRPSLLCRQTACRATISSSPSNVVVSPARLGCSNRDVRPGLGLRQYHHTGGRGGLGIVRSGDRIRLQGRDGRCLSQQRCWMSTRPTKPGQVSVYKVLEERGYINQTIGTAHDFNKTLSSSPNTAAYVGIDPTAPSLHIGHLLPFLALIRIGLLGHDTVALVGSGTARIGDPTGRTDARIPMSLAQTDANAKALEGQMRRIYDNAMVLANRVTTRRTDVGIDTDPTIVGSRGPGKFTVLQNDVWMRSISILEAVAELGPAFRIGRMLGRDTVKTRIESGSGMALSEFMYPFLQALDWVRLFHTHGVGIQVGGSDQFGNILAGADGLKYVFATVGADPTALPSITAGPTPLPPKALTQPLGLTVPLLKSPSGAKFGKSAGNAVWLDDTMTSPFDLYAYFMATPDATLGRLFRLFTFVPSDEIDGLTGDGNWSGRPDVKPVEARHRLATEVVALVHGLDVAASTTAMHRALFGRGPDAERCLTVEMVRTLVEVSASSSSAATPESVTTTTSTSTTTATADATTTTAAAGLTDMVVTLPATVLDQQATKLLRDAGLVGSIAEARKLIASRGVYVGVTGPDGGIVFINSIKSNQSFVTGPDRIEGCVFGRRQVEHGCVSDSDADGEKVMILRVGKKKIRIVRLVG